MIALSTAWVGPERPTVEETIRQAVKAGFAGIELGAWGEMPAAKTLVALGKKLGVTYTSVHNIAYRKGVAAAETWGDGLASAEAGARRRAVEATVKTVELARAVGARYVVVHAGNVPVGDAFEKQKEAQKLILAGDGKAAALMMRRLMRERNAMAPASVETAAASIAEVFRRTGDFPLALECRVHFHSIPQPGELDFIMTVLAGRPVFYWHDVGHARIGELLGLAPAVSWLEAFGGRLAGIHFHDVRGFKDHRVPGTGDVDFRELARYATEGVMRVIEVPPFPSAEELVRGKAHLEAAGIA